MDGCKEVARRLVVACRDGPVLFELGEEILDEMASLVEVLVERPLPTTVGFGWDDGGLLGRGQRIENPLVGVEGFVGDQHVGPHLRQETVGPDQIVSLTTAEAEPDRVAQRIDQRMDLGAQAAAGSTDGLVRPGFFWAPALC